MRLLLLFMIALGTYLGIIRLQLGKTSCYVDEHRHGKCIDQNQGAQE